MRKLWIFVASGALALLAVFAVSAAAGTSGAVKYDIKLSSGKAGGKTGLKIDYSGTPKTADGKNIPASKIVLTLPKDSKYVGAKGTCKLSTLQSTGTCPKNSVISVPDETSTSITPNQAKNYSDVISGIQAVDSQGPTGKALREKLVAFNSGKGIIFRITGLQTLNIPASIKKNVVTVKLPRFPVLPTQADASLAAIKLTVGKVVQLPDKCPKGGWKVLATVEYNQTGNPLNPTGPTLKNIPTVTKCKS